MSKIRSTHTGSLPRPDDLITMMFALGDGVPVDAAALDERVANAVGEAVQRQVDAGVSIVNDGEMSKPSYATYVKDRLDGFEYRKHKARIQVGLSWFNGLVHLS